MKCSAKKFNFTFVLVLFGSLGFVFLLKVILWIFLNEYPLLHEERWDCETSQSEWVMQLKWSEHLRLLSFYPPEQESGDTQGAGSSQRTELGRLPAGCPRIVETLQSVVTPNVELFSGIFGQVSGQEKHYFINKLRKGVWIATAERLHKSRGPAYFPSWRT